MHRLQRNESINESLSLLKKRALYYLGKREYSQFELRNKLKNYAETLNLQISDLDNLLKELQNNQWQSDERFTELFIESKKNKFGLLRIVQELKIRGIEESVIQNYLAPLRDEQAKLLKMIWEKKYKEIPKDQNDKLKQIRFLQSRGFDLSLIHKIMSGKEIE